MTINDTVEKSDKLVKINKWIIWIGIRLKNRLFLPCIDFTSLIIE